MKHLVLVILFCLQNCFGQATLILHNGRIVTVDTNFTIHEAIAVLENRIRKVGSSAAILELKEAATEIIDLKGAMVLPGLIDSHVHPVSAAMIEFDHPIPEMESIEDVLRYFAERAGIVPEGEWL